MPHEPSYGELMHQFEHGWHPPIKGFPAGWEIVDFYRCSGPPHRDAVVWCQRVVEDGDHGTRYVVWDVNMIEGGCYHGSYVDRREEAQLEFTRRKGRLT